MTTETACTFPVPMILAHTCTQVHWLSQPLLAHTCNRSIGYHNRNTQLLAESAARLMHLRVYDNRDISRQPAPSPSLCYSLTHAHRSIGYRNRNTQLLTESAARLMYLRVYDSRDSSRQLHLPRPYATRSHMHTGPLVIATATPSFLLNPPRD